MRRWQIICLISACFAALFLVCYQSVLVGDRQFGYRDAAHYYYPLHERVQREWNEGRWPLWEPEENSGMPLAGNPTAAVFYPGKVIFALFPYAWAARIYVIVHTAVAFATMLVMMRGWGTSWVGSTVSALSYAFGAPILFQYCNVIFLVGASWLPLGIHAADQWLRLGRRWAVLELGVVLSLQVSGGDPQAAYLLGLSAVGYASGLAWSRRQPRVVLPERPSGTVEPDRNRGLFYALGGLFAFAIWWGGTVYLGQLLPQFREVTKPPPPRLPGTEWVPAAVNLSWGIFGLWLLNRSLRRRQSPLLRMGIGLAAAAILAAALCAIQLLPVVEFTQLTTRAAGGGPHDIYPFSLAPARLIEMIWPNVTGIQFEGNHVWGDPLAVPGYRAKVWVPSLYLGGLTLILALSAIGFRNGSPWQTWLSVIVVLSALGSLGEFTSPIGISRHLAQIDGAASFEPLVRGLGPRDPNDTTAIRLDGYLRDGDGSIYWWMTTVLPGFRQFRFPSKLFTFTTLGLAALAGIGWDRLTAGRARAFDFLLGGLLAVSSIALAAVYFGREPIVTALSAKPSSSLFGPFSAQGAYRVILTSLVHASIVLAAGLLVKVLIRPRPALAAIAILLALTGDLAAANGRLIFTVPQALFEGEPEISKLIASAEKEKPSPGPFRVHRMPMWSPARWQQQSSPNRIDEFVEWERNTLQPKYGINEAVEYTHTLGVAELYDYEWYFGGFYRSVREPALAQNFGVEPGTEIVYFPRRSFDMWNTRYFIVPSHPNGWKDEHRGYAAFSFQSETIFPDPDRFRGKAGAAPLKEWIETRDYQILRNLQEYPRAWIVHAGRSVKPVNGLSRDNREEAITEIVYADDPLWHDSTRSLFNPRNLVWLDHAVISELAPFLSGTQPRASETAKVSYPDPQTVVIDATLDFKGIVVLADVFYPGWELTIDGKPAKVYQVNRMMRGAAVDEGKHRLVYQFNPSSFRIGRIVSLIGLAVLALALPLTLIWPGGPPAPSSVRRGESADQEGDPR